MCACTHSMRVGVCQTSGTRNSKLSSHWERASLFATDSSAYYAHWVVHYGMGLILWERLLASYTKLSSKRSPSPRCMNQVTGAVLVGIYEALTRGSFGPKRCNNTVNMQALHSWRQPTTPAASACQESPILDGRASQSLNGHWAACSAESCHEFAVGHTFYNKGTKGFLNILSLEKYITQHKSLATSTTLSLTCVHQTQ